MVQTHNNERKKPNWQEIELRFTSETVDANSYGLFVTGVNSVRT